MKLRLALALLTTTILFANNSFAADVKHTVISSKAEEEAPKGKSENPLITNAPLATDFVLGKKDAPVIIVEYASLSCPHCASFSNSTLPEIQKKYIDSGKVAYILRQFPLNEPAFKGAMLVDCVGAKDSAKYYLFSKVLFDAQSKWAFDGDWGNGLETIARVGGVSKDEFQACIFDKELEKRLLEEKKQAADSLKIPHTPFFYINSEVYNGSHSIEDFSKVIDAELVKKVKK